MKVEFTCLECGKVFETYPIRIKRGIKFCSTECRNNYHNKHKTECTCLECGKIFHIHISDKKKEEGRGRFCSITCKHKYDRKTEIKCQQCGKKFKVKASTIKMGKGKFCSVECQTKHQILPKEIVKCKECNIELKVLPSRLKDNRGRFCSKICHDKWMSVNTSGENGSFYGRKHTTESKNKMGRRGLNHPNYGKSLPPEQRKKLSVIKMGELNPAYIHGNYKAPYCYVFTGPGGVRIRALLFADYKCEECGKTNEQNISECGKSLVVHHGYFRKMSCCETELDYDSGILRIGNILYIEERDGTTQEHEIIGKPEKFIVLCTSCHGKTNGGYRSKWIKHYEDLINTKYSGKSFLTKEEYLNYNQT